VDRELSRARAALLSSDVETALESAQLLEEGKVPTGRPAGLRIRAGVELARGDNQTAGLHAGRSYTLWAERRRGGGGGGAPTCARASGIGPSTG